VTPLELVEQARAEGLTLEAAGDRLRVRPKDRLPPELRAALIAQKPAILQLLGASPAADDPEVARRVDAFRAQLAAWTAEDRLGVPLLALPDAPPIRAGACVGCGGVPVGTWRCAPCLRAVERVLGLSLANPEPSKGPEAA
jgi:hypothetical protein